MPSMIKVVMTGRLMKTAVMFIGASGPEIDTLMLSGFGRQGNSDQGLCDTEESLADDAGVGKKNPKLTGIQQFDVRKVMVDIEAAAVGSGPHQDGPEVETRDDNPLPGPWKPVDEGSQQVLFDGEPAVRRLHPIPSADACHFARELLLAAGIAHMLDHGVAEDEVETLVGEGQPAAVRGH